MFLSVPNPSGWQRSKQTRLVNLRKESLMLFWSKLIGGIVLVLVGVFWMLQGLNVIQGQLMSGQTTFFVIGLVVALVGAWLLWSVRADRGKVHVG